MVGSEPGVVLIIRMRLRARRLKEREELNLIKGCEEEGGREPSGMNSSME